MWAEARKQEKKLRGLMVDHKRRAERRRDFYEKTKLDPNQFLQIHGQSAKIHLDQNSQGNASSSNGVMMPWQGQKDNLIDRFDGRAHLDFISESAVVSQPKDEESSTESRLINYERYRILVQNDFLKIPEEKFLQTISYEEKYGSSSGGVSLGGTKAKEDKKKSEKYKSAIGYVYEDTETVDSGVVAEGGEKHSDEYESDLDLDLTVDVSALDAEARACLNKLGKNYNLGKEEFIRLILQDIEEARVANLEKQREEDKALFSQKKTRRERRLLKSRSLIYPRPSTPSYSTPKDNKDRREKNSGDSSSGKSRSHSPENPGKIEFITSFGNDSEEEKQQKEPYRDGHHATAARQSILPHKRHHSRSHGPSGSKYNEIIGPKLPTTSRSYRRRDRHKSRSSSRSRYTPSRHPKKLKKYSNQSDSSSSSSSDDNRQGPRYRSKYRSRRDSSSSPENIKEISNTKPQSPPMKRYYQPTLAKESSDELNLTDGAEQESLESGKPGSNTSALNGSASKSKSDTVKAKIQRKLQAQLKKQFKADKKAENEKKQRQREEQNTRDVELKEVFSKYKKREPYSRHRDNESSDSSEEDRRRYRSSRRSSRDNSRRHRMDSRKDSRSRRRDRYESDSEDDHHRERKPKLVDY